jgi:peroxiredoxin/mono/diheme cytochrome c family protein
MRSLLVLLALLPGLALADGPVAPEFSLPDFHGREFSTADFADSRILVVAFLGTECPLAKLYGPKLQEFAAKNADRGVAVVGVFANQQDGVRDIENYANRYGITFPLLKDLQNKFADAVGATRTPEVFVYDEFRKLRYRGRIDEQYGVGYGRHETGEPYLANAVDELLAGKAVSLSETDAVGCLIGRVKQPVEATDVTYSNQVARVLQQHCVECHRAGEIGPFSLTDYDEVAGWADTIAEVVRDQRMPPWGADPKYGHFANARLMTDEEKQILYDWAAGGAPAGDPADLPEPTNYVDGWRLPRQPDVVVAMRSEPYQVPAQGIVEYQYFAVDPGFTEDKWVKASDIVPGDKSVVHHTIVFISPPGSDERRGLGWLSAYVPGQSSMLLPEGHGRLIPAGSKLIFQQHYTTNGKPTTDLTKIGLVFADPDEIEHEVVTLYAVNEKFEIPPGADNHRVAATIDYWPEQARLLAMSPHMHLRGKSFKLEGRWPDGRRQTLLDVPAYDFNWQFAYELADPIELDSGFEIACEAHFDNSAKNPANPDPTAAVRWGDQSFEEMMIAFFEVAVPRESLDRKLTNVEATDDQISRAQEVADRMFRRFDRNGDNVLNRDELPEAFGLFALRRYDASGDKRLERQEVVDAALRQIMRHR